MSEDTPELRADATDDQDPVDPPTPKKGKGRLIGDAYIAADGSKKLTDSDGNTTEIPATVEPTCPICGLTVCGHNLPKT